MPAFTMPVITKYVIRLVAVGMASFHVYTSYAGTFYPYVQRSLPVMLSLILTFLMIRARKNAPKDAPVPIYDWILVAVYQTNMNEEVVLRRLRRWLESDLDFAAQWICAEIRGGRVTFGDGHKFVIVSIRRPGESEATLMVR